MGGGERDKKYNSKEELHHHQCNIINFYKEKNTRFFVVAEKNKNYTNKERVRESQKQIWEEEKIFDFAGFFLTSENNIPVE